MAVVGCFTRVKPHVFIKIMVEKICDKIISFKFLVDHTLPNVNHQFFGDDSSIPGVIEVCGIDETPTLMSFSQLIHRFTCKWILKGYWLRQPSACTYHANVMLSDTYTLNTQAEISGLRNRKTVIDCTTSHYQQKIRC